MCSCGQRWMLSVFPAMLTPYAMSPSGERVVMDDQASCFYHSSKKAVIPCDHCGRFLCSLCDMDLDGVHLCPKCLEDPSNWKRIDQLQNQRALLDNVAIALCLTPLVLTAVAGMGLAIKRWQRPDSILDLGNGRKVLAIAIGLVQLAAGGWLLFHLRGS